MQRLREVCARAAEHFRTSNRSKIGPKTGPDTIFDRSWLSTGFKSDIGAILALSDPLFELPGRALGALGRLLATPGALWDRSEDALGGGAAEGDRNLGRPAHGVVEAGVH